MRQKKTILFLAICLISLIVILPFVLSAANIAPTKPSKVLLSPTDAYANTTFICNASGSTDKDKDALTYFYEFRAKKDVLKSYSKNNTYKCINIGCRDLKIQCYAKAYDGKDYSAEKESNSVTIKNSAPFFVNKTDDSSLAESPVKKGENIIFKAGISDNDYNPGYLLVCLTNKQTSGKCEKGKEVCISSYVTYPYTNKVFCNYNTSNLPYLNYSYNWFSFACDSSACSKMENANSPFYVNYACEDSDKGKEYSLQGNISGANGKFNDICLIEKSKKYIANKTGNWVKEYYCDEAGFAKEEDYKCENGCEDGACKKSCSALIEENEFNLSKPVNEEECKKIAKAKANEIKEKACFNNSWMEKFVLIKWGDIYLDSFFVNCGICNDSDLNNENVTGLAIFKNIYHNKKIEIEDECQNESVLEESYCENNLIEIRKINCKNGCNNGKCIKEEKCEKLMGINPHIKAKARYTQENKNFTEEDYCFNNEILIELGCKNNQLREYAYTCLGWCQDGACIAIEKRCNLLSQQIKEKTKELLDRRERVILTEGEKIYTDNYVVLPLGIFHTNRSKDLATNKITTNFRDMITNKIYSASMDNNVGYLADNSNPYDKKIYAINYYPNESGNYITLSFPSQITRSKKISFKNCDFAQQSVSQTPQQTTSQKPSTPTQQLSSQEGNIQETNLQRVNNPQTCQALGGIYINNLCREKCPEKKVYNSFGTCMDICYPPRINVDGVCLTPCPPGMGYTESRDCKSCPPGTKFVAGVCKSSVPTQLRESWL